MQIRICFDTQHMFVMLMHTILCNTSNNGSSREISFTRDKTGVKPSTLERSVHRQCVRRCISVDHRWIIFHLITRQLLRADESQGIKKPYSTQNLYDQTHLSWQKEKSRFRNPIVKFYRWESGGDGKINDRGGGKQWWSPRGLCEEISSDEISERNRLWVSCLPPPLPGGNRAVICGHWWFLWPPRNPRK